MRIGYSFWGFIGPGITDTPDGGRSFRAAALQALGADHELLLLQANRDLNEADVDLRERYTWDPGYPELDVLFLEWRWPLPGRNTTACGTPGHTCDLHRQNDLLAHYTHQRETRTLIWDLDQTLDHDDPLRQHTAVTVLEPALHLAPGAATLWTPVLDVAVDRPTYTVDENPRRWPLVYVGNQYDRDQAFDMYFAPAARVHDHRVAGKWTQTARWPHINFTGRTGYTEGQQLLREAVATITLLPERYAATGHMTSRLAEAVIAGCFPIGPAEINGIDRFVPKALHAESGEHAAHLITWLDNFTPAARIDLLDECLAMLAPFRASAFAATVNGQLAH